MSKNIKQFVEKVFKDFPKNDEVHLLKNEMKESLEDKYQRLLTEGKNEEEALEIIFNEFGDISELKQEYGVHQIKRKKMIKKLVIMTSCIVLLILMISLKLFINQYHWNSSDEVKVNLIYNQLIQEELFQDIVKVQEKPYIHNVNIAYETEINNLHYTITRFNYRVKDPNMHSNYDLPGLALLAYTVDFNGKINVSQFDYLVFNSFNEKDHLKLTNKKDKKELLIWGINNEDYHQLIYSTILTGRKQVDCPKGDFVIQHVKMDSILDTETTPIFLKNINQRNETEIVTEERLVPPTYYYGTRFYLYDEHDNPMNTNDIEDYTLYYDIFDLKLGKKLYGTMTDNWHDYEPGLLEVKISYDLQLFYPNSIPIYVASRHLYKDFDGNIVESGGGKWFLQPTDTNKDLGTFKINQYYTVKSKYNLDHVPITLDLDVHVEVNDPLKLLEYKVIELDQNANKIKETIIDYTQAQDHVIYYDKSDDCAEIKVIQTFLNTDNEQFTLTKTEPREHLYYLNVQDEMEWFTVLFFDNVE